MNVKTTLSITEARKRIFEIAEAVQTPGVAYTLTDKGRPKVALVSAEEYESWLETFEVAGDERLVKGIKAGVKDLKSGRHESFEKVFGEKPAAVLKGRKGS